MDTLNVRDELEKLVAVIFREGKTIHGRKIAGLSLTIVEGDERSGKILVPYWLPVFQYGRGKAKSGSSARDSRGLTKFGAAIYDWMAKYGLFRSTTEKGKINDAKSLAWYINKYGNLHHRRGTYIDIYDKLTQETIDKLTKEVGDYMLNFTSELI